jgi:hypothetical protein
MGDLRNCRSCKKEFIPTAAAIKKSNWICSCCRGDESRASLLSRKDRGLKVSGSRMTLEYERERAKTYLADPNVKERLRVRAGERRNDPEEQIKIAARSIVRSAIMSGNLHKKPCERCGSLKRIHAHHDDYLKPTDVRWLCPLHHAEHHKNDRARGEA